MACGAACIRSRRIPARRFSPRSSSVLLLPVVLLALVITVIGIAIIPLLGSRCSAPGSSGAWWRSAGSAAAACGCQHSRGPPRERCSRCSSAASSCWRSTWSRSLGFFALHAARRVRLRRRGLHAAARDQARAGEARPGRRRTRHAEASGAGAASGRRRHRQASGEPAADAAAAGFAADMAAPPSSTGARAAAARGPGRTRLPTCST